MFAFAHLLGIRPWEIAQLSVDEFEACCAWVDAYIEQLDKQREGRR